jgi:hypothetical protein
MNVISAPRRVPLVYPESDGKPMADNTKQARWIVVVFGNLLALFRDRLDVFVAADLFWYPVKGEGKEVFYVYDPDTNRLTIYLRRGDMLRRVHKVDGFVSPRLGIRFDLSARVGRLSSRWPPLSHLRGTGCRTRTRTATPHRR